MAVPQTSPRVSLSAPHATHSGHNCEYEVEVEDEMEKEEERKGDIPGRSGILMHDFGWLARY